MKNNILILLDNNTIINWQEKSQLCTNSMVAALGNFLQKSAKGTGASSWGALIIQGVRLTIEYA